MSHTMDLGRRIELISMDPHFQDISIGLYRQGREYLVHSYSQKLGTSERLDFVARAMVVLGGLEEHHGRVRFGCGEPHQLAVRRVFIESCKLQPDSVLAPRPLMILDKRSNLQLTVAGTVPGAYRISSEDRGAEGAGRVSTLANGLAKLAEMVRSEDSGEVVAFACGHSHDRLVGLLLYRALNVRAALREEEMASSRGVLVTPSAQK